MLITNGVGGHWFAARCKSVRLELVEGHLAGFRGAVAGLGQTRREWGIQTTVCRKEIARRRCRIKRRKRNLSECPAGRPKRPGSARQLAGKADGAADSALRAEHGGFEGFLVAQHFVAAVAMVAHEIGGAAMEHLTALAVTTGAESFHAQRELEGAVGPGGLLDTPVGRQRVLHDINGRGVAALVSVGFERRCRRTGRHRGGRFGPFVRLDQVCPCNAARCRTDQPDESDVQHRPNR